MADRDNLNRNKGYSRRTTRNSGRTDRDYGYRGVSPTEERSCRSTAGGHSDKSKEYYKSGRNKD